MKKSLFFLLNIGFYVLLLLQFWKGTVYAQNSLNNPPEIIVVFKEKPTVSVLSAFTNTTAQNLVIKNAITASNAMVFSLTSGNVKTVMSEVARNPNVKTVFPNYIWSLHAIPNDPMAAPDEPQLQWNLYKLNLAGTGKSAWNVATGSPSVIVAVIDTGVQSDHPDMAGKIDSLVDCTGGSCNTVTSMTDAAAANGHGTHVAGIVAAATNNGIGVAGVGYNTKLMIVKVYISDLVPNTDKFLNGIRWAADHGAKVINISSSLAAAVGEEPAGLGEINDAIFYAWDRGAVVVASAGNCGGNTNGKKDCAMYDDNMQIVGYATNPKLYPGASPNVIGVAATTIDNSLASYSERNDSSDDSIGNWVSVAAPGGEGNCKEGAKTCILSTLPGDTNDNQYRWLSGTSMASPAVAGVAALVFAANPGLSNSQVKRIIETSANHSIAADATNFGLVNALAAVTAAGTTVTNTPTTKPTVSIISPTPNLTPTITPKITPVLSVTPSSVSVIPSSTPIPTASPTATPTLTPTATPTLTPTETPYPTTGISRLPKILPNPYPLAPFCPRTTVSSVSNNTIFMNMMKNLISF